MAQVSPWHLITDISNKNIALNYNPKSENVGCNQQTYAASGKTRHSRIKFLIHEITTEKHRSSDQNKTDKTANGRK